MGALQTSATIAHIDGDLFDQRARTAFRAISDRRRAESFAARAGPPLRPPSRPNETAAGFFFFGALLRER
jgi:hypothetical protein